MVRAVCPHCGEDVEVRLRTGDIRRITYATSVTVILGMAQNCVRRAARLTTDPEALRIIIDTEKSLRRASVAVTKSIDEEARE